MIAMDGKIEAYEADAVNDLGDTEESIWQRCGAFLKGLENTPHPRLTTFARIFIMVGAVGLVLAIVLADIATASDAKFEFPTIYYIVTPDKYLRWQKLTAVCDTARTPGGDCDAYVRNYGSFVAYGLDAAPEKGDQILLSTASNVLQHLPIDLISGLTLGACSGAPTLGVVFETDTQPMQNWKVRHLWSDMMGAALASSILVDSGYKPLVYLDGFSRHSKVDEWCMAHYIGGRTGQHRLGFQEKCFINSCNWTRFESESINESCFSSTSCVNERLGFGFGPCIDSYSDSPGYSRTILFLLFSLGIAALAEGLSLMLISAWLDTHVNAIVPKLLTAWPALHRISKVRSMKAPAVYTYVSIFMCLECSACGQSAKLTRSFTHLADGCHGAVIHVCFVVGTVLPMHLFLFFASNRYSSDVLEYRTIPKVILVLHYSIQVFYACFYYLRWLPFNCRRGLLTWLYHKLTLMFVGANLLLLYTEILWMLSAIYFNRAYVLSLLTIFGSVAGFCVHSASVIKKYTQQIQKKMDQMHAKTQKINKNLDLFVREPPKEQLSHMPVIEHELPGSVTLAEAQDVGNEERTTLKKADEAFEKANHDLDEAQASLKKADAAFVKVEQNVNEVEQDTRKLAKELEALHITGTRLYLTLGTFAILMVLSTIFVIMGAEEWRGGVKDGYSITNLLTPLIALSSKLKSEGEILSKDETRATADEV